MAAKPVNEIIDKFRHIHQDLQEKLDQANRKNQDSKYDLMLDYLKSQEEQMDQILNESDQMTREGILNTFVRYYPIEVEKEIDQILDQNSTGNIDDVLGLLFQVKRKVIDIYQSCSNSVVPSEVRAFFDRLQHYEKSQLENYARRESELEQGF